MGRGESFESPASEDSESTVVWVVKRRPTGAHSKYEVGAECAETFAGAEIAEKSSRWMKRWTGTNFQG